jgi:hypothetical protein
VKVGQPAYFVDPLPFLTRPPPSSSSPVDELTDFLSLASAGNLSFLHAFAGKQERFIKKQGLAQYVTLDMHGSPHLLWSTTRLA